MIHVASRFLKLLQVRLSLNVALERAKCHQQFQHISNAILVNYSKDGTSNIITQVPALGHTMLH